MDQSKPVKAGQVEYLGRWVDRAHFCAFVYNKEGQRLAKSYDEFSNLLASGLWFASKKLLEAAILKVADSTPLEVELPKAEVEVLVESTEELIAEEPIKKESTPAEEPKAIDVAKKLRESTKNKLKAATSLGK